MAAHQSSVICHWFDLHNLFHVSIAASVACVMGLQLTARAAQGEALFDIHAGLHIFPAISSWCFLLQASGLMVSKAALHISVRVVLCAVEHNCAIV